MRDRVFQPDAELLAPARMPVMRERSDASVVRAALDLQQRAGNRSVTELVERSHAEPDRHPLAALSDAGHTSASAGAASAGSAPSVQREPCTDCPEAAVRAKAAGPEAAIDPGQLG